MSKTLFSTDLALMPDDASPQKGRGLGALKSALTGWRVRSDVNAIAGVFDRLSNRQLHMIGLRRETLLDAVEDMMLNAQEERAISEEVIAILDASAENAFSSDDLSPAEEQIAPMHDNVVQQMRRA